MESPMSILFSSPRKQYRDENGYKFCPPNVTMGIDAFDDVNQQLAINDTDVKGVFDSISRADILVDIFIVLGFLALVAWIVLFTFCMFGKSSATSYVPVLGYSLCVMIAIYTARVVYKQLDGMLSSKCDGQYGLASDFIIETRNRFYTILSFVYYYVKAYVHIMLNIAICFLSTYLFYLALRNNVIYEKSSLVGWVDEQLGGGMVQRVLLIIYLVIGAILAMYFYIAVLMHLSSNLLGNNAAFKRASATFAKPSGFMGVLLVLFIPACLYLYERYSNLWVNAMVKSNLEVFALFKQHVVFDAVNFLNAKTSMQHVRIFIYGIALSMIYAFFVLPTYDVEHYCALGKERDKRQFDEYKRLHITSKQFDARFKFGFFVVISVVIFLYIWSILQQLLLVSLGAQVVHL